MFCPKCGAEVKEGSEFCGKCGTSLKRLISEEKKRPHSPEGDHSHRSWYCVDRCSGYFRA